MTSPAQYHASIGGQTFGPADIEELRRWFLAGSFAPTDFVWDEATNQWMVAASLPALTDVFLTPTAPAALVEDADELPAAERAKTAESEKQKELMCENHELSPATIICPKCQRSFCANCVSSVNGMKVCLDCIGTEKAAGASFLKRYGIISAAVLLIGVIMITAYIFFANTPEEQAATPERIDLKLTDDAPQIASESLRPSERATVEEHMKALVAALQTAATDTASDPAALASENWIATLASTGLIPSEFKPPRDGLAYRRGEPSPTVELWSLGEGGRCFIRATPDTFADVPRPR